MADNNLTPQSYEQVRQQEIDGVGIASPNQVPWSAQQSVQRQQEQQVAQAAAKIDAGNKTRQSFPNVKYTRAKGAK